jgi:nicotinate phosphoribosyltransferase
METNPQAATTPQLTSDATLTAPAVPNLSDRIEALKRTLPERFEPFSDKYFLRTHEILKAEGVNPWVRAQVFIRKGPGEVAGIEESLAMLERFTELKAHGGKVYALPERSPYKPMETLMVIEGPMQDIIALETLYLGALTSATTRLNDKVEKVDLAAAESNMRKVVELTGGRPVSYFGARHWSYTEDPAIAYAAYKGGATSCSTDAGAATFGQVGQGTIPHALENIYAWRCGKENAVVEATLAFDRVIDPEVPRIALIDYNNRELDDSVAAADALKGKLYAVRVDTCGENVAQGALISPRCEEAEAWKAQGIPLPSEDSPEARFWYGTGVTVTGVYALRRALDQFGHKDVKIILTSGFGDPAKVQAFVDAERTLGVKLFDALGVGGIYKPCRMATMDVVAVGETEDTMTPISKVGRPYNPNPRLTRML